MPKLYCCCTDPDCSTYRNMVLTMQVWGFDTAPKNDGRRSYFEVSPDVTIWGKYRRDAFEKLVENWRTLH